VEIGSGVRILTTIRACVGTRQATSLLQRSVTEIGTIGTYTMLSTIEMHMARLKVGAKNETASSANDAMNGTMITTTLTTIIPTCTVLWKEDTTKGGVKAFSRDLKRVSWPLNFKPLRIEKYDGSSNPVE
jgi:hypothetical protein